MMFLWILFLTLFLGSTQSLAISDEVVLKLAAKVEALEARDKVLTELINHQKLTFDEEIIQLKNTIHQQNIKIEDLQTEIDHVMQNQAQYDGAVDVGTTPVNLTKGRQEVMSENAGRNGTSGFRGPNSSGVTNILRKPNRKRLVLESEGPVAFHATTDKAHVSHLGLSQKISLDVVLLNLGNGYHDQHGIFICPQNGIYIFSVSIFSSTDPHANIEINLVKDGVVLGRSSAHGGTVTYDQGSVTVVTQLNVGDEVWLEVKYPSTDAYYFGGRFTTFSGCLID